MWHFSVDVGGTFTDCIGRAPDGRLFTHKTLSSGAVKGRVDRRPDARSWIDAQRRRDPPDLWVGWSLHRADSIAAVISGFDRDTGRFTAAAPLPDDFGEGAAYELRCQAEAPLIAIRHLLGLRPTQPLPVCEVRLGTTRGTNALLERKGAPTAFVTTRGFADVLRIGNQDRPRLFDLAIQKPEPLFSAAIEIDERIAADGSVLESPVPARIRQQLLAVKTDGISAIAICLLNSYVNPVHERLVESVARELGFDQISVSSQVSPRIKLVSRGDTTVLDAYLTPVLRTYVASLKADLGAESRLRLMTSAGGLVDAASFSGKDSLLSGPAGGVIGYGRIARQAGFEQAIGFDMGGTSTDVSRSGGAPEYEFESQKAGVRVAVPALAVETVAAGGGSVCRFDGIRLVVGPHSAGADPGPACYGRGGPLTVTDMNLALGRLLPHRFPFRLDLDGMRRELETLRRELNAASAFPDLTAEQLAAGFVDVANASMARAIRRVSTAKGYDPAEHVLVTFGGAGGLHACALARELAIRQVVLHPLAGLLSAYGIGMAEIRRQGELSVLKPLSNETLRSLQSPADELEERLKCELTDEGCPASEIQTRRTLDMRYQGIDATISVPWSANDDLRGAYETAHQRLYGYCRHGRDIEIAAVRIEASGGSPADESPLASGNRRISSPFEHANAWVENGWRQVPVFLREQFSPGDALTGPAIVCEPTSTIWVEAGFSAEVLARGELLLTDQRENVRASHVAAAHAPSGDDAADPVLLEIFNNQFASIAEQMGLTLQRTALSTNVKERLDFSCALFDADGRLIVNAPHIPVHLGAMGETVRRVITDHPDLGPGDVYVTNDPYRGGSHLPDITVITPVHSASGELRFFAGNRAHHAEIGGIVPGSMPPFSKSLSDEGVLIRNFKLVDRGQSREDDFKKLLASGPFPSRNIADNLADVAAQSAANQRGAILLEELIARRGWPQVRDYMRLIRQSAAHKMRLVLASLPDGDYRRTDILDDGSPVSVTITIAGARARVDFSGTGPVLPTNLNANRAIVTAATMYVFRCLINEDIPLNEGVLEPVEIVLPRCLLNPEAHDDPAQCAAIVGGNVETSQRVVDVLLGALGLAAASQGTMNNLAFGNETFGYYETICGGSGATRDANGADAVHTHMTNTRLTDPEIFERHYPVRLREFSIRRNSGGAGRRHGGDGVTRHIQFLAPLSLSLLSQRRGPAPPFGLAGGQPGALGRNTLIRVRPSAAPGEEPAREKVSLTAAANVQVQTGDELIIETPGGGGFGQG